MWVAEQVPFSATLFSFIYGVYKFFKKGKPLFLQNIIMAMDSHALGIIYHLCQTLTTETVLEGFTPAYLGRIGFFLFFIAASYGQMDRIIDVSSKNHWILAAHHVYFVCGLANQRDKTSKIKLTLHNDMLCKVIK